MPGFEISPDAGTLAAARAGDGAAFARLLAPYWAELHAHCYRMLGSVHDAEDALQEVGLRAWSGLAGFEGRSSLRSWLHRIVANTCLTAIERRSRRVLPMDVAPAAEVHAELGSPLAESVWLGPLPDRPEASAEERESVELAFVAVLQHLPGNQRASLIMREVLGFSAEETASALKTTTASVNSALQRARRTVAARLPERSQQATLRELGDEGLSALVGAYVTALADGDVDAILVLLTEDATWSMPPVPQWFRGPEAITAFLVENPLTVRWRHLRTTANGQPAVGCYCWDADEGAYVAYALDVLTLRGDRIAAVCAFIDRELFADFGLPDRLPARER